MATGKKSFIAYADWYGTFKSLPDDVAGKLIKHIFSYVNDEEPTSDDFIINALFEQIKSTLKRDLSKWEEQRIQRSEAGKRSAELRATKFNERSNSLNENVRNPTVNDNDNVNVNVNDNVNDINNIVAKATPQAVKFNFRNELVKNGVREELSLEFMQVRKLKKLASTETAFLALKNEIEKSKKDFSHIIKICVENSWGGFKASWLENKTNETFKISNIQI